MEIKVTSQTENKLFDRKEIYLDVSYKGNATPSKESMSQEICKKLSLNPALTVVTKITQAFGNNSSEVLVYSYIKKETMAHIERIQEKKEEKQPGDNANPGTTAEKKDKGKAEPAEKEAKKEDKAQV
jgi:ribosomal protein S24E